ncbi:MAG: sulfatase-like hydrolase/transferase, partial [Planctomycetota bacterium]
NRREFVRAMGAGAAGYVASGCAGNSRKISDRRRRKPNLLFIWTDEQRADTMAVYGNRKIRVPNFNKLASESVVFKKAYVTQPVCTPNRSAVMTGLWPHTTGLLTNNIPLPKDTPCLNELIGDPDYRAAYMGKWHLGDEIFAQHGFGEWVSMEDGYSSYYSEDRDRNARSSYHHYLLGLGHKPARQGKFSRGFAASLALEQCKPKFLERSACDFLRRHRNEPFMLYINFLEPHMPFTGPLDDMYDPDEIDLPPNFNDPLEENEPESCRKKHRKCAEKYGTTEEDFRKLIARYWGLNSQVDLSVGAILDTLEQLDLADDTIVVYTSDHGDMMGSHHLVEKGLMYEEATLIPWLMRVPAIGRRQRLIEQPVSQIDLVPTLLELMGRSDRAASLPGQSLVPLIKGGEVARDYVFIEWNTTPKVRTVVSPDGWKLCLSKEDKCQLFNLGKDPYETTNLYDSGEHEDVIAGLTEKIRAWQKETNDKMEVI